MDVTDVLRDRMQPPAGLQRMVTASLVAHAVVVAAILFTPNSLMSRKQEAPRTVMTITIGGGGDGPKTGGLTAIGGRPVQVVTPPDEPPKREAVRPPAAKVPEMTVPLPKARPMKPVATPAPPIKQAPDEARGRTPTKGPEVQTGSAIAQTGAKGEGFGVSSGGGGGSGSQLDVADFCCPEYIAIMQQRMQSSWNDKGDIAGAVRIKFTIQRDGRLTDISVERPSGNPVLDQGAQRAVILARQLPPLPAAFPNPTLTVYLNFQYER